MKFSVFTPSHSLKYIDRPINSLLNQTFKDFEWVLLLNGDALKEKDSLEEKLNSSGLNYKIIQDVSDNKNIGYLKKRSCEESSGDFLVELDHDDALMSDCLEELSKAFDEGHDFCYSSDYAVRIVDGKETYETSFSAEWGWKTEEDESGLPYHPSFAPSALSFSYIWYAPDHVRSWNRKFYNQIGGHNAELEVCDDYDLLCRTYINGRCHLISKPLYKYYFHEDNTAYGEKNKDIQELTHKIHDQYALEIASKWSDENGLKKVDLCSCNNKPKGFVGVDARKLNEDDIVLDLNKTDWPFEDGSVGVFRAQDAVEHMKDPLNTMKEIYRCLADYGWAVIDVPSTDGRGAFQDPTHVSYWNSNSFWYYTKSEQAHFIGTPVKFQLNRINNYYPSDFHEFHRILYTKAHLVKLPEKGFEVPVHGRQI